MGIEPTYSAWEADVLPLNYTRVTLYLIYHARARKCGISERLRDRPLAHQDS